MELTIDATAMGSGVDNGYKVTDIGIFPKDWDVNTLETFWLVKDCKHVTAKFFDDGYPLASINEVQSRFINLNEAKKTNFSFYTQLIEGGRSPQTGDLIISRNATVGEIAQVADWHPPFAMGQDVCLLRKRSAKYSTDYLQQLFKSSIIKKQLDLLMVGSTFKRINILQIRNLLLPMPSPEEQQRISNVISSLDDLMCDLEKLIIKKQRLRQGLMQEMLRPKVGWQLLTLGELESLGMVKLSRGNVISKLQILSNPGDYPIYSSSILNNGLFGAYGDYMFDEELITWSIDGGGDFFYRSKHKFSVTNVCGYMKVNPDYICCKFFVAQLQLLHKQLHFDYTQKAHPSIIRKLYKLALPEVQMQREIGEVLSKMEVEIIALQNKLNKYQMIKQGLMQELLTGKTRLI